MNGYGGMISDKFPIKESIVTISGNIQNDDTRISRSTIGAVYYSDDKKKSIQTRVNGFAFAQVNESYTSWEHFQPIAFKELQAFIDYVQPLSINRFSLRFINEIKIPTTDDLNDYIKVLPNVENINLPIRQFVARVELDKPEIGAIAIVSQLLSPPFDPSINVFLDIDVIINNDPPLEINLPYLSERFESLRQLKNEIFFSSLTEKVIDSYS